jgi:hypothetical protein
LHVSTGTSWFCESCKVNFSSFHHNAQTSSAIGPTFFQRVPGYCNGYCFLGGTAAGTLTEHPSPTGPEFKNAWSYNSTPPYYVMLQYNFYLAYTSMGNCVWTLSVHHLQHYGLILFLFR